MGIYKMKSRVLLMFILVAVAYFAVTHASGNVANAFGNVESNPDQNIETISGGETDEMMNLESELDMETEEEKYASVENNDAAEKQLLELEKQKQELELENQKMQLKQLENNQVAEATHSLEDAKDDVKGLGLCNQQHNYNEKTDSGSLLNMGDCNSDYYT